MIKARDADIMLAGGAGRPLADRHRRLAQARAHCDAFTTTEKASRPMTRIATARHGEGSGVVVLGIWNAKRRGAKSTLRLSVACRVMPIRQRTIPGLGSFPSMEWAQEEG